MPDGADWEERRGPQSSRLWLILVRCRSGRWTRLQKAQNCSSAFLRRRGSETGKLIGAGGQGFSSCSSGFVTTTLFSFSLSISSGSRVVLMGIPSAMKRHPHPLEITRLIRGDPAIRSRPPAIPGEPRGRPHTHAPGAPTRAVTLTAASCSGNAGPGWLRDAQPNPRRMLQRGARRPPQATRARMPQKFGSGSVGSEMQPKPRFTERRANKHKHAHRRRRTGAWSRAASVDPRLEWHKNTRGRNTSPGLLESLSLASHIQKARRMLTKWELPKGRDVPTLMPLVATTDSKDQWLGVVSFPLPAVLGLSRAQQYLKNITSPPDQAVAQWIECRTGMRKTQV
ncbi:uncharacterized protein [Saccopteryx leptura]|uniref:uncharacterized protein n=1 Tax=Saccopteryx leptura TaxID=249018 RepID=UPI00339C4F12